MDARIKALAENVTFNIVQQPFDSVSAMQKLCDVLAIAPDICQEIEQDMYDGARTVLMLTIWPGSVQVERVKQS